MSRNHLEHVNLTVSDPQQRAALLSRIFDWHIRWQGDAMNGGKTVHVGDDQQYLALYTPKKTESGATGSATVPGSFNHVALQVEDLDEIEQRVKAEGLTAFNHGNYEPGRRFYFYDPDGIEFEVVEY